MRATEGSTASLSSSDLRAPLQEPGAAGAKPVSTEKLSNPNKRDLLKALWEQQQQLVELLHKKQRVQSPVPGPLEM